MRNLLFGSALLLALVGCGGQGSMVNSGGTDRQYGVFSTRAVGGVGEPVVAQGAYASITGIFGANFTSVSAQLVPDNQLTEETVLNGTLIAFANGGRPYLLEYGTWNQFVVNPSVAPTFGLSPSFASWGEQFVVSEYDQATGMNQIFQYNTDGAARTRITSLAVPARMPNWSPTAARIAFGSADDIWAVNTNGTGLTQLTTSPELDRKPRFRPDGARIGWLKEIGPGSVQFWDMTNTGASQTQRASLTGYVQSWDYFPGGDEIIYATNLGPGVYRIYRYNLTSGLNTVVVDASDPLYDVSVAPTGSHIVYARDLLTSLQIEVFRLRDNAVTIVNSMPANFFSGQLEWGPALRRRNYIAPTSGVFHTNAAGFIYSMRGADFASVLAFDAVTRNTVDIDVPPSPGFSPSNLFATITAADSITMLRYANGVAAPRITVVDPASATTWIQGAVVSFDALTGRVAAVVPFNRSRSGESAKAVEDGGKLVVRGELLGVWDADGKKTVGASSEITLEAGTGKVLGQK